MKTTLNGKTKEILGRNDINEIYTSFVQMFLSQGYVIYSSGNTSGTQGEESKIHFSKDNGKTIFKLYIDRFFGDADFEKCKYISCRGLKIVIEKFENNRNSTLWNGKGELYLEEKFFAVVDRYDCNAFVKTIKEYEEFYKFKEERWEGRHIEKKYNELKKDSFFAAIPALHKIYGYKYVRTSDIDSIKHENDFFVVYFNNNKKPACLKLTK